MIKNRKITTLILSLVLSTSLLISCANKKEDTSTNNTSTTEENKIEYTKEDVQENGLTKSEEEKAKKLTEEFAKSYLGINYKTDTKETYQKWIGMMDDFGQETHNQAYVESEIQSAKESETIYIVQRVEVTSISKIENIIYVDFTLNANKESSSDSNNGERTIQGNLSLNSDFKISSYKF